MCPSLLVQSVLRLKINERFKRKRNQITNNGQKSIRAKLDSFLVNIDYCIFKKKNNGKYSLKAETCRSVRKNRHCFGRRRKRKLR